MTMQVISRVMASTSASEKEAPSRKPRVGNYGDSQSLSDPPMSPSSPTLTVMKTTSHNYSMIDEFSQYVETAFGACEGNEGQDHHHDHDEDLTSATFWELLITMYLPLSALWLRQSVFGITVLVRTVLLGHLLRLVFGNLADWINEKSPWLHSLLLPMGPHSKPDPKAWPPPALSALALFTVVTFVVHPDGFTWVMLGKVKKAIFSILQALSECWQLLITDYGVMPSIFASITIAALIFLMFLMLRSVTPKRTRQSSPPPDKRKKKRKGHTRRGHNGKIKAHPSTPSRQLESPTSTTLSIDPPSPVTSTFNIPCSHSESLPLIPNLPAENPTLTGSQHATPNAYHTLDETPKESTEQTASRIPIFPPTPINSGQATFEKEVRGRARLPSVSTIDTTTLSDDMSCESNSIRSELSVHVPYTLANHAMPVQPVSSPPSPAASTDTPADHQLKRGARTQSRRNNRAMGAGSTKSKLNLSLSPKSAGNDGNSRWDALRPNSKHTHTHTHVPERHNLATRNPENSRPNHLHPGPRSTIRRNGRGGAGNPKRGGRSASTHVNHNYNNHNHIQLTTGLPQTPSSTPQQQQFSTQSPISPPSLERCPRGNTVMPPTCVPSLPPQGLGTISSTRNIVVPEGTQFFSVLPKTSADVPLLLPSFPSEQSRLLYCPTPTTHPQAHISPSFLSAATDPYHKWNSPTPSSAFPTSRLDHELSLPTHSRPYPGDVYFYAANVVKENPFAPEDSEAQIEAHLQALGGQMAGSILDF